MTYAEYEKYLIDKLQYLYDRGEAVSITNWVMEELSGFNRSQRRQMLAEQISPENSAKLQTAQEQLMQYKPVQYVLGYAYFYGIKFLVNDAVLIPRPETEELIAWIVNLYKNNIQPLQVLDIGTGSGCIPVILKKKLPFTIVSSLDIGSDALLVAEKNAIENGTDIQFRQLNFLDEPSWSQLGMYNIVVSNPPYIPQQQKTLMDRNVTSWEPDVALFVPDNDPLLFYKKIAAFGKTHLLPGGAIFMETHQDYAGAVQQLFIENKYQTELKQDINGNERMVMAVNNE